MSPEKLLSIFCYNFCMVNMFDTLNNHNNDLDFINMLQERYNTKENSAIVQKNETFWNQIIAATGFVTSVLGNAKTEGAPSCASNFFFCFQGTLKNVRRIHLQKKLLLYFSRSPIPHAIIVCSFILSVFSRCDLAYIFNYILVFHWMFSFIGSSGPG